MSDIHQKFGLDWDHLSISYWSNGLVKWSSQVASRQFWPLTQSAEVGRTEEDSVEKHRSYRPFRDRLSCKRVEVLCGLNQQLIKRSRVWWIFKFYSEASHFSCLIQCALTANLTTPLILPETTRLHRSDPLPLSQVRLLPHLPFLPPFSPRITVRTGPYPISLL